MSSLVREFLRKQARLTCLLYPAIEFQRFDCRDIVNRIIKGVVVTNVSIL
jgi:hypothetical protein